MTKREAAMKEWNEMSISDRVNRMQKDNKMLGRSASSLTDSEIEKLYLKEHESKEDTVSAIECATDFKKWQKINPCGTWEEWMRKYHPDNSILPLYLEQPKVSLPVSELLNGDKVGDWFTDQFGNKYILNLVNGGLIFEDESTYYDYPDNRFTKISPPISTEETLEEAAKKFDNVFVERNKIGKGIVWQGFVKGAQWQKEKDASFIKHLLDLLKTSYRELDHIENWQLVEEIRPFIIKAEQFLVTKS